MKSKFNLMSSSQHTIPYPENYAQTLMNMFKSRKIQAEKEKAKDKEDSIEQRLRRLEEAVFGDIDDGR